MSKNTKFITFLAAFTALATVANIFVIPLNGGGNYISLLYIPCFFAGIFLGPVFGFVVGALSDVIGMLIHPLGPWLPLITLASGLLGFIPGMVFKYMKNKNTTMKLFLSLVLCLVVCTCGLNTLATYLAYSKGSTFWAYLGVRLPLQIPVAIINFIVIWDLLQVNAITKALTINKKDA